MARARGSEPPGVVDALLARLGADRGTAAAPPGEVAWGDWRNPAVLDIALIMGSYLAADCTAGSAVAVGPATWEVPLQRDGVEAAVAHVVVDDAGEVVERFSVRPPMPPHLTVREVGPSDVAALARLELSAPVRRDDGTTVRIDHRGTDLLRAPLLPGQRVLGVFDDDRMLAVQAAVVRSVPIDGREVVVSFNHGSRSDPAHRRSHLMLQLISRLYGDLFPSIDTFVSYVDVRNAAGLALSGGEPWPTSVRRLLLPVAGLVDAPPPTLVPFDAAHVAALLEATHGGGALHRPVDADAVDDRLGVAPAVYGPEVVRSTAQAVLGVWTGGEEVRTYTRDGIDEVRSIVPVVDVGLRGDGGRRELLGLLGDAARRVAPSGVTHLAVLAPDGDERLGWLAAHADHVDEYVVCAPQVEGVPWPSGPAYVDPLTF